MTSNESNIFLQAALDEMPRLLGQLNRNPASRTYGSFDRSYWHYRTVDVSCARYQEAVLVLALLFKHKFKGNAYAGVQEVPELIAAVLRFTVSIQQSDGSFDEWYPFEGSFVCTAFVAVALARTVRVLGDDLDASVRTQVVASITRAAEWLTQHREVDVANQLAGGVCALQYAHILTEEVRFRDAASSHLDTLLAMQSSEGWWPEYGGPDVGYLSLLIDYLESYRQETGDTRVDASILKATAFLVNFRHPDKTVGGTYMARNTEYVIPSGLALRATHDEHARCLLMHIYHSAVSRQGVHPFSLDDRYVCYTLSNWLRAGLTMADSGIDSLEVAEETKEGKDLFFAESGIVVRTTSGTFFVSNGLKGGAFRLYAGGKCYVDSGLEVRGMERSYISLPVDRRNRIAYTQSVFTVQGTLKAVSEPLMKTPMLVAFRAFQWTFGRFDVCKRFVKRVLRARMISHPPQHESRFNRTVRFHSDKIVVIDEVIGFGEGRDISFGMNASYNFIPSARYSFGPESVYNTLTPQITTEKDGGTARITRTFDIAN